MNENNEEIQEESLKLRELRSKFMHLAIAALVEDGIEPSSVVTMMLQSASDFIISAHATYGKDKTDKGFDIFMEGLLAIFKEKSKEAWNKLQQDIKDGVFPASPDEVDNYVKIFEDKANIKH